LKKLNEKKSIFNGIIKERRKTNIMKIVFLMKKSMCPIFNLRRLSLRIKIEVYGLVIIIKKSSFEH
jgi:hypothetical protein